VNGDGYTDVIVGSPSYTGTHSGEGSAFLFLGSESGIPSGGPANAHAQISGNDNFAGLGGAVASAGDVNGDGYGDVVVGAPEYRRGEIFVYHGSPTGIASSTPTTADAVIQADPGYAFYSSSLFGSSVASAGDVNGDGYSDLIVGAPQRDVTALFSHEGAAYVFLGSASGIASVQSDRAHAVLVGNQSGSGFGTSVASAGDVNGDGYSDVIVGAPRYDLDVPSTRDPRWEPRISSWAARTASLPADPNTLTRDWYRPSTWVSSGPACHPRET
jgi:hypothetical protein